MARMKEIYNEILHLYTLGYTCKEIAEELDIPRHWVDEVLNTEGILET